MGYTGLHQIAFDVDFAPGIEIGWRLAHEYWGQGYAPEAATACLEYTRNKTDIKELFSFYFPSQPTVRTCNAENRNGTSEGIRSSACPW